MLDDLKANNRAWAERMVALDPDFSSGWKPSRGRNISGSAVPTAGCRPMRLSDLAPGEMFVHRNVANLAPPQDANYLSVLQFAVDVIKVRHVIVVGHYGCGGIAAAVDGKRRGLVDHWLHPIREVAEEHQAELMAIADQKKRLDRLCELNVCRQVRMSRPMCLCRTPGRGARSSACMAGSIPWATGW